MCTPGQCFTLSRGPSEVNVDCNTVGWYQSTYLGSHITESMVSAQYNYQVPSPPQRHSSSRLTAAGVVQESIPKCVCLVFDPLQQSQGKLGMKALRLSTEFMELYKGGEFTLEKCATPAR